MRQRAFSVAVLLAAPAILAGCLGDGDDAASPTSEQQPRKSQAEVTVQTGGIQGIVTDQAINPVPNATVSIPDLGVSADVEDDGSYSFSRVRPGDYTLTAQAEGFEAREDSVTVRTEEVSTLDFILPRLASQEGYVDVLEFKGFQECASLHGYNHTEETGGAPGSLFFLGVTWCSIPNFFVGENTTNDRFIHFYTVNTDLKGMVLEFDWEPTLPPGTTGAMVFPVEASGISNDNDATFAEPHGHPPLRADILFDKLVEVDDELTKVCESEDPIEQDDDYCRAPYASEGGEIQVRAFPNYECQTDKGYSCFNFQQPFTVLVANFYNTAPPEGYTIAGGQG